MGHAGSQSYRPSPIRVGDGPKGGDEAWCACAPLFCAAVPNQGVALTEFDAGPRLPAASKARTV